MLAGRQVGFLVFFALLLVAALLPAAPADAAFPGRNGPIAFNRLGEDWGLYLVEPDGSNETRIQVDGAYPEELSYPSFFPDGTRLAFGEVNLRSIGADGTDPMPLLPDRYASAPSFSADGAEIAYEWANVHVADVDGSDDRQLTEVEPPFPPFYFVEDQRPNFSPDGTQVVFGHKVTDCKQPAEDCTITRTVRLVAADRSAEPAVVAEGGNPDFAPDGEAIFFDRDGWIYSMDSDGSDQRRLVKGSDPSVSPDGMQVAYIRDDDLFVAGSDGSHPVRLTKTPDYETNPDWGPLAAPQTVIDFAPPAAGRRGDVRFTFSSPEPGVAFECRLDPLDPTGGWEACSSPARFLGLGDGDHAFDVRAVDAEGDPDPTYARRLFTVDRRAPHTSITAGPKGVFGNPNPRFRFSSDEAGGRFECRLDSHSPAAWQRCSSGRRYRHLGDGRHRFEVRAIDRAGNRDRTPAVRRFTVDARGVSPEPFDYHVLRIQVPDFVSGLIEHGVRARVRCSRFCRVDLDLTVSRALANRLGLRSRRVGHGAGRTGLNPRWITARLRPRAARRLREADDLGTFTLRTRITARPLV